jgi:hypothetical protein
LIIAAAALLLPAWLLMLGAGNLGLNVGLTSFIPFAILFWWLVGAIFAPK